MELFKKSLVAVVVAGTMANGLNARPSLSDVRQAASQINLRYAAAAALATVGSVLTYDTAVPGGSFAEDVTTGALSTAAFAGAALLVAPSLKDKVVAAVMAGPAASKKAFLAALGKVPSF